MAVARGWLQHYEAFWDENLRNLKNYVEENPFLIEAGLRGELRQGEITRRSSGRSGDSWVYLYQGGRYDTTTGLYNLRNCDYLPTLGA